MAALNQEVKSFIVQALACFDPPSLVAQAVQATFGVGVSRQQVEAHDPSKRCSKGLAKRWVTLFDDTRAAFREAQADIPIANRSYRLRALSRMFKDAESRGNLALAAKLLEQAARESGDLRAPALPTLPVPVSYSFDTTKLVVPTNHQDG